MFTHLSIASHLAREHHRQLLAAAGRRRRLRRNSSPIPTTDLARDRMAAEIVIQPCQQQPQTSR
jgi:hypothetical protein